MLSVIDSNPGRVKADHSSFFQLFCLNIFTMNGSGKKSQSKNNNKDDIEDIYTCFNCSH